MVGQGDMLLSMGSDIIRLQCAFVDTPEVERICAFVGNQRGYEHAYQLPEFEGEDGGSKADFDTGDLDTMFAAGAVEVVKHQLGSVSLLQRKLKMGFARSGKIIDQLEDAGIVGPNLPGKAREVLVHDLDTLEIRLREMGLSSKH